MLKRCAEYHFKVNQKEIVKSGVYKCLAKLKLPIYLTTNYDDLMTRALNDEGIKPEVACCRWNAWMRSENYESPLDSETYRPSPDRPLIYHLHGRMDVEESIVLSEDDYIQFLSYLTEETLEPAVRGAASSTLLFIGYSHADWNVRAILQMLNRKIDPAQRPKSVTVQIDPWYIDHDFFRDERRRIAMSYTSALMKNRKLSVFWGTAEEFCEALTARMEE